jgi:hypothetical protein
MVVGFGWFVYLVRSYMVLAGFGVDTYLVL